MSDQSALQAFNSLQEHYYSAWFRFHPERAVHVGVAGFEERLRAYSDDDMGALIALNEKALFSLDELDFAALTADQQMDYSILYNAISIELHDLLERDWRYYRPQDWVPVEAIHQLLTCPVEHLHTALKHRMQAVPELLRAARGYLQQSVERIPPSWLKLAVQKSRSGARFFRELYRHPVVVAKFQNPSRLQPLCDQAAVAMDDFARFLEVDIGDQARGSYACGERYFGNLLREAHFLDVSPTDLHRFGQCLFDVTRDQLQEVTRQLHKEGDMDEVLASIRHNYPKGGPEKLLDAYRQRMKAAYDFVSGHHLVSIPEPQSLRIMPTPEFLRHEVPFAAYQEPTYKDPQQQGYYYVTPVASEGHLLEHNWTSIDLTCVHEAYPGHHLQFVTANRNPANSLPRLLNASATLYEGWALYCEDLMHEQGFLSGLEHQFIMLRDRLWRAMRVMLDVELHCAELSLDRAAQRMCDELSFSIDQAMADLNWYTQAPTVPMGYATGWALIKALREQQSAEADFSLGQFHDQLLSVGSCALPLVIRRAFGEPAWKLAREYVFED